MKRNKLNLLLVAVFVIALAASTAFALPDDSVLSQNVKEADGTSGQDTNSGSGIKTGHIQDGAVTTGKIVDNSITTNKISDSAVTTPKIADGAVTDTKISGTISGSKLGSHTHSGLDIMSGTIGVERLSTYKNVRVVHKGNADGINTFNSITDALASIIDANQDNPYTILVMPGVYFENITTKDYVSIKGFGKEVTKITSSTGYDNNISDWTGTIKIMTDHSPIEGLTIENTNQLYPMAVYIPLTHEAVIDNCSIIAQGGNSAYGVAAGLGKFSIKNSDIYAIGIDWATGLNTIVSGGGGATGSILEGCRIYAEAPNIVALHINNTMQVDVISSNIAAAGTSYVTAVRSFGAGTIIKSKNSSFVTSGGSGTSVEVTSAGTFMASHSNLTGGINLNLGTLKLLNCFDENFNPIANR